MKRRLIPPSGRDRVLVALGLINVPIAATLAAIGDFTQAGWNSLAVALPIALAYVFQDAPKDKGNASDYTAIIARISGMATQLAELNAFLQREQARIAEAEATVKKLADERTKLEPVVLTQREAVEAILTAHAERSAKNIWKERIFGFGLGAGASLIASFIYDYIRR